MPDPRLSDSRAIDCRGNRKRCLIVAASALVTIFAADAFVRRMAPTLAAYDVADYQRKPNHLALRLMPDIVLMGSSRAKYALVPKEFRRLTGLETYNLAIAGTKVAEWQTIAEHLFSERRPRLLVLGVNASEFRADYLPTYAARNLFDFHDLLRSIRIEGPSVEIVGQYLRRTLGPWWATYDRRYELKMFAQEKLAAALPKHAQLSMELRARVAAPVPADGFEHPWQRGRQLRNLEVRLLADPAGIDAASVPAFSPNAAAWRRLEAFLVWSERQAIPMMVAYVPNCPRTERRWAEVEPRIITKIAEICRARGVPFLPCEPRDLPRTNADYLEEIHVGLPLAERISRRIAKRVVALGLINAPKDSLARGSEEEGARP